MNYELGIRNFFAPVFIIVLIFIDQLSKYIIRHPSADGGGFYVCNPDIALGIELSPFLFWLFWASAITAILWAIRKRATIALALILAGALSNMIDRLALGCVVDFIDLKTGLLASLKLWRSGPAGMVWPLFNLADIFIVSGALWLVVKRRKMW